MTIPRPSGADTVASVNARGPLTGVRIVEFAGIGPGPFAAMLLADLGAEVVRIERPTAPALPEAEVLTRNRVRIRSNLKNAEQRDEILRLLEHADALIEGYRPGVMERLGLGPEVVLQRNGRLVYGRMTGWGQNGPLAHAAGHDINYIAITGALHAVGPRDRPIPPLNLVGDYGGGAHYLTLGLLSGLLAVRNGNPGQVVDVAICDGTASMMAVFNELAAAQQWEFRRESNFLDGGASYYRTYECADGRHIAFGSLEPQFFRVFCEKTGFKADERTRENPAQWPFDTDRLATLFKTRTCHEWDEILGGTDACVTPVLQLSEAPSHPHLAARQTYISLSGIDQPAPAPRFSATPAAFPCASSQIDLSEQIHRWASVHREVQ
jgi:alpha-methylacyl-CoA racemase